MRSGWKSSNCLKTKRGFGLLPRRRAVQRCLARAALFRRLADAFIGLPENLGGLHSCARLRVDPIKRGRVQSSKPTRVPFGLTRYSYRGAHGAISHESGWRKRFMVIGLLSTLSPDHSVVNLHIC